MARKKHAGPEAKLSFGELKVGEKFIGLYLPGDNRRHGGYRKTHFIFQKLDLKNIKIDELHGDENSVKLSTNVFSHMPDSMPVIRVE